MKVLHVVGSHASAYYFGVSMIYAYGCIRAFVEAGDCGDDGDEETSFRNAVLLANLDGTWSVFDDEGRGGGRDNGAQNFLEFASAYKSDPTHEHGLPRRRTLAEALAEIAAMSDPSSSSSSSSPSSSPSQLASPTGGCDIVQPHMFCYDGMTLYRSVAGFLNLPLVGSDGPVMALTTHKWRTRAIVQSHGVPCPEAQCLRRRPGAEAGREGQEGQEAAGGSTMTSTGDDAKRAMLELTMKPPFLVKPAQEDNSLGITLVTADDDESKILEALETAFFYDNEVLVEQFIPLGRELRVGVVDAADDGGDDADGHRHSRLEFLTGMEYFLGNKAQPIRTSADKLSTATTTSAIDFAPVERKVPADIDDALLSKLRFLAETSHDALGCRHYSLYDVRVCPNGEPYFIECSPYCSFSPASAIAVMASPSYGDGARGACTKLFRRFAEKAIADHEGRHLHSTEEEIKDSSAKNRIMGMRARPSLR